MRFIKLTFFSFVVAKAVAEGDTDYETSTLGKCDFDNDCDNDSDCAPGLLCTDDHKDELRNAGIDERVADCGTSGIINEYWEVCFDPSILNIPVGGGFGDPHFQTYDGTQYSFHGECDLVMARSRKFRSGLGLDVHVRTTIVDGWSLISNAAIRLGEDTFEIVNDGTSYLNGIQSDAVPSSLAGNFSVSRSSDDMFVDYLVDLGKKENIKISIYKNMLTVSVNAWLSDTEGMLGSQGTGGLLSRDGTIAKDANEMGFQWQVRDNESKLFSDQRVPQYPERCILPTVNTRRLRQNANNNEQARVACADVKESMRDFCIHDVVITGDASMAQTYTERDDTRRL